MLEEFADEIVANAAISQLNLDALPPLVARRVSSRWEKTLLETTRDVVACVVEPAEALARAAAPGDVPHAISSVVRRLRKASPYDYFPEIVEQYAQRKGMTEITGEALASLLHRIDRRMTEGFVAEEWVSLAEPLFELGRFHPSGAVPAELVRRFLAVRGADTLISRIPEQGRLTIEDVRERLGVAPQPGSQESAKVPESADVSEIDYPPPTPGAGDGLPVRVRTQTGAVASDRSSGDSSEPTLAEFFGGSETDEEETEAETTNGDTSAPLWKRFLSKDGPAKGADDTNQTEADNHVPLWKRFSRPSPAAIEVVPEREIDSEASFASFPVEEPEMDVADIEPQSWTLEDLEEAVLGDAAGEWRSLYVDSLFKGKEEQYERVLGMLRLALDWPAASDIIAKEVFKKNKVDIYAVPAVAFTDAVEARFVGGE